MKFKLERIFDIDPKTGSWVCFVCGKPVHGRGSRKSGGTLHTKCLAKQKPKKANGT